MVEPKPRASESINLIGQAFEAVNQPALSEIESSGPEPAIVLPQQIESKPAPAPKSVTHGFSRDAKLVKQVLERAACLAGSCSIEAKHISEAIRYVAKSTTRRAASPIIGAFVKKNYLKRLKKRHFEITTLAVQTFDLVLPGQPQPARKQEVDLASLSETSSLPSEDAIITRMAGLKRSAEALASARKRKSELEVQLFEIQKELEQVNVTLNDPELVKDEATLNQLRSLLGL